MAQKHVHLARCHVAGYANNVTFYGTVGPKRKNATGEGGASCMI